MKLPRIDLKELEKMKEENFKERLEFVKQYADHVRKAPNKVWSSEQKDVVGN